MDKMSCVCFYDHETNKLVSWDTIRASWRENIADGGIDDCTLSEYVNMITDFYSGFCQPVYDLSDYVIYEIAGFRYVNGVCVSYPDYIAFERDTDDDLTECILATENDIQ